MFEQSTLMNAGASRRAWSTGLGFAGEAALVAFIAIAPTIWPQALPKPQALLMLLTPPAPVPPPTNMVVKPRATHAPIERPSFTLPASIPKSIARIVEEAPEVAGAVPGPIQAIGAYNSLIDADLAVGRSAPAQPEAVKRSEPPVKPETAAPRRIRTSSIELARIIHRVEPAYPNIAKLARISGTVELQGIIGTDGHIRELKALSGNALLVKAALDAVSQWIYAPPILNGERVEVIAPITVNFRLDR